MNKTEDTKKHVFLVEDDKSLSSVLCKKLEKKGYEVTLFEDGVMVKDSVKELRPDIVLLDIQLPVVDGLDVLSELKKDPETNQVPVIMLTNLDQTSPKILKATDAYPPELYLVKSSWTLSALLEQIEKTISKK